MRVICSVYNHGRLICMKTDFYQLYFHNTLSNVRTEVYRNQTWSLYGFKTVIPLAYSGNESKPVSHATVHRGWSATTNYLVPVEICRNKLHRVGLIYRAWGKAWIREPDVRCINFICIRCAIRIIDFDYITVILLCNCNLIANLRHLIVNSLDLFGSANNN
jgi:hypothetical protein